MPDWQNEIRLELPREDNGTLTCLDHKKLLLQVCGHLYNALLHPRHCLGNGVPYWYGWSDAPVYKWLEQSGTPLEKQTTQKPVLSLCCCCAYMSHYITEEESKAYKDRAYEKGKRFTHSQLDDSYRVFYWLTNDGPFGLDLHLWAWNDVYAPQFLLQMYP